MSWSTSFKECINCAFWQGKRCQAHKGSKWETDSPGTTGECAQHVKRSARACDTACDKFVEMPR